jgi:signal transduction histidine kinase
LLLEVFQQERRLAGEVRLEIGTLEQVEVEGDRDRLKQLLLNLVDNGLRYTPPGGMVRLGLRQEREQAVLEVQDTGPGIAAEHLPHIFERFYRVDGPRSRGAGGTGLGLAICRWVAEAHGGSIGVESQLGVGSVFRVELPVQVGVRASISNLALTRV